MSWRGGTWAREAGGWRGGSPVYQPLFNYALEFLGPSIENFEFVVGSEVGVGFSSRFSTPVDSYSLTGTLPAGLVFSTQSAELVGQALEVGVFGPLQVGAVYGLQEALSNEFTLTVVQDETLSVVTTYWRFETPL